MLYMYMYSDLYICFTIGLLYITNSFDLSDCIQCIIIYSFLSIQHSPGTISSEGVCTGCLPGLGCCLAWLTHVCTYSEILICKGANFEVFYDVERQRYSGQEACSPKKERGWDVCVCVCVGGGGGGGGGGITC